LCEKVIKRDETIVPFEKNHIKNAIKKAMEAVNELNETQLSQITLNVESKLNIISKVEEIQDMVEKILIEQNLSRVAKAYIIHRHKREEIRKLKARIGVEDDLKLPINSLIVLASRYLLKGENGEIIETTKQLFIRVAKAVAEADYIFGTPKGEIEQLQDKFYNLMTSLTFLPNSPTLMNAGTKIGQLSACFVLPIEDDTLSIMNTVTKAAIIHKSGGGTGFSFSKIRPVGDIVKSTGGIASGALSFMRIFDVVTDVIKQGGKRRGANMAILRCDHPEILEFISMKEKEGYLSNFNISVAITDNFMDAVINNKMFDLINPRNHKKVVSHKARVIWNSIIFCAWKNGEPAVVFIDRINSKNTIPTEIIESTNPCGEQPLTAYESCNLGSINLSKFVKNGVIDWESLKETVHLAVHFLDNVITINTFPFKEIEEATLKNRKIGLGVMGFADMLVMLKISYNSEEAIEIAEKIMKTIQEESRNESEKLGIERGSFPNFDNSIFKNKYKAMRNATTTTIAPTGTIGEIGGCSSGIEPLFSIMYIRNVEESIGYNLVTINSHFENECIKQGIYSENIIREVSKVDSIQNVLILPIEIKKIFVTSHDISPEWHVRMQATFQKYTDNAVSKTINLPYTATPNDIEKAFMLAYQLGCKGITVYRDKSRQQQIICLACDVYKGD